MRLYRIVPNTLLTSFRGGYCTHEYSLFNGEDFFSGEELLYPLGITSFNKTKTTNKSDCNSFTLDRGSITKHFFLFPQDAITCYKGVIGSYQALEFDILEYDFPIEQIYKYIGYGKYFDPVKRFIEFAIPINEFNGVPVEINKDELQTFLIQRFNETFGRIEKDNLLDNMHYIPYGSLAFDICTSLYGPFLNNKCNIEDVQQLFLESSLFNKTINMSPACIKTDARTGRSTSITYCDWIKYYKIMSCSERSSMIDNMLSTFIENQSLASKYSTMFLRDPDFEEYLLTEMGFSFHGDPYSEKFDQDQIEGNGQAIIKTLTSI